MRFESSAAELPLQETDEIERNTANLHPGTPRITTKPAPRLARRASSFSPQRPTPRPPDARKLDTMAHDDEQEQRALRSIEAITAGANIGDEAFQLANEFTDRHTGRMTAWLKRRLHRS